MPALRIHYTTLGTPRRDAQGRVVNAVMALHGTGGSGKSLMNPVFADVLFAPGGKLDIAKWYVILPDGLGHGGSSKPSDGLHARFPHYNYADMVAAQHALLVDGLKVDRLRLLMGTSMGCMHAFVWGETYPGFAQALMPLACLPIPIAGRNRMWRQAAIDAMTADPLYNGGDYTQRPEQGLRTAADLLLIAGATPLPFQIAYPTPDKAEAYLRTYVARSGAGTDANDLIYALAASRDYDPSAGLETITAPVTWINSADDFINPPELGVAEREAKRLKQGRFVLIPISEKTHGHGTHTWASLWEGELAALIARSGGPP
jgi:homoserine O-acetyltransferase